MLSTHDLACLRGDRRLFRDLSISLQPGRLLRVEGANGSGKTSLLRLLAGLALPAAGEVRWQGRPIRRQREAYLTLAARLSNSRVIDCTQPLDDVVASIVHETLCYCEKRQAKRTPEVVVGQASGLSSGVNEQLKPST